jgi:hypothetical protein
MAVLPGGFVQDDSCDHGTVVIGIEKCATGKAQRTISCGQVIGIMMRGNSLLYIQA